MGRATLAMTIKPEANQHGQHVVRIQITKDRLVRYWPLNLTLPEKQFNPKGTKQLKNWVRRSCYDHGTYNDRLHKAYVKAEKAVEFYEDRDLPYTADEVRAFLEQGGFPEYLLPYFAQHITARRAAAGDDLGKIKTADGYESTLKVLRWHLRETNGLPDSLTDDELDRKYWLLSRIDRADMLNLKAWMEQSYAPNSVSSFLSNLRHVLNRAADEGLVSREQFPLRGISMPVHRKKVQRLIESEIDQLATAPERKRRGGNTAVTDTKHARPLALAMYYVHGARLGDAIQFRAGQYQVEGDEHRIRYKTGKNKREMSVLLDQEARDLLAPYRLREDGTPKGPAEFLFPYLPADWDSLPTDGRYLELRRARIRATSHIKRLGGRLGLAKAITPHIMRHSFADMMRRSHVPLDIRQQVLGHADARTTQFYEEQFDQAGVDSVSLLYQKGKKPSE